MKYLITNADDFGFTRDVNRGIVEAHRNGILTATTLMANGAAFDDAVAMALENPNLDVGVHLVLVDLQGFPPTIPKLILSLPRMHIYELLAAQVKKVLAAGIQPSHLDTHKHTHLLPPVFSAVVRIAEEFHIPWIRRRFGPLRWLPTRRARTTDHFAGFRLTGRYGAAELAQLIRNLPEGSTEFMCHPGFCTEELRAARTRLKDSRRRELDALSSPEVRAALEESGVKLARYRDL
ncbi:MAG TPA: ChbG/HpnK family deacetylase [Bryobacteraceae bacterium]|nr:ChbG/HpnK family deacetylase [Bryobacteraceae bacterium]